MAFYVLGIIITQHLIIIKSFFMDKETKAQNS